MATLYIILIYFASIFIGGWLCVEIGQHNAKRAKLKDEQETDYHLLYSRIQKFNNRASICHKNYCIIAVAIGRLHEMKYKNPEMTNKLDENYKQKFIEIHQEILAEANDEFSYPAVFGN